MPSKNKNVQFLYGKTFHLAKREAKEKTKMDGSNK